MILLEFLPDVYHFILLHFSLLALIYPKAKPSQRSQSVSSSNSKSRPSSEDWSFPAPTSRAVKTLSASFSSIQLSPLSPVPSEVFAPVPSAAASSSKPSLAYVDIAIYFFLSLLLLRCGHASKKL